LTSTERTEPVTPSEPAPVAVVAPDAPRRRDRVMTFGLAGVAALFVGWLAVDAVGWIAAAFERSTALGVLALAERWGWKVEGCDAEQGQEAVGPQKRIRSISPRRPHPAPDAAQSSSADEVKKAVEPYEADQDEIDRDNKQNQDASDGGQPHGGGPLLSG
jgi:hypothetical protein